MNQDGQRRTALDLLAYPDVTVTRLAAIWPELASLRPDVAEQLEIEARYRGYLDRQAGEVAAFRREEAMQLPDALDYRHPERPLGASCDRRWSGCGRRRWARPPASPA